MRFLRYFRLTQAAKNLNFTVKFTRNPSTMESRIKINEMLLIFLLCIFVSLFL